MKLTYQQANFIKECRALKRSSHRMVATHFAEKYPEEGICPDNQIDGSELIHLAEKKLETTTQDWIEEYSCSNCKTRLNPVEFANNSIEVYTSASSNYKERFDPPLRYCSTNCCEEHSDKI